MNSLPFYSLWSVTCESHKNSNKMYLHHFQKGFSEGLSKHKPKKLLPWFHISDLVGHFWPPTPHQENNLPPHSHTTTELPSPAVPWSHSFHFTYTEHEFTVAFQKCSEITFLVVRWNKPVFPLAIFQVTSSPRSTADIWAADREGRGKQNKRNNKCVIRAGGWHRQNCFLQQCQALSGAWAPTARPAETTIFRDYLGYLWNTSKGTEASQQAK